LIKPNSKPYQQCTRCVMDTSDPEIQFNEKGQCNHCTDFFENKLMFTYHGEKSDRQLKELVSVIKTKSKNNKYDALLGISGGVDSCYMAYKCKEIGLNPLLFHLDNGWNSEISARNIENVSNYLGFDLVTHVMPWEEFKDVQLAHLRASTPELETPTDIAILEHLHKVAVRHNIPFIIMGGNYISESILPKSWHYNPKDLVYSRHVHALFGEKKVKNFPSFTFWYEAYCKLIKRIKILYLLNYVNYNKHDSMTTLKKIGWQEYGEKHHESIYTKVVQSYILPIKFNIDYRKATLSNKICSGEMKREDVLEILKLKPYNEHTIRGEIEYVCKKLEISVTEFDLIMERKPQTFESYKNEKQKLESIYALYRRFSKKLPHSI